MFLGFVVGLVPIVLLLAKILGQTPNRFVVLAIVPMIVIGAYIPGIMIQIVCMYAWTPFLNKQEVKDIVLASGDPRKFGFFGKAFIKLSKFVYKKNLSK
jgi:hypothetical protein